MILESQINDASKVAFDCCKATISKGSVIDVADIWWHHPEIQGALKIGIVKLRGEAPNVINPADIAKVEERMVKLVSKSKTKLAFDCVKSYVDQGQSIMIPESKIHEAEIQNALAMGLLENPDSPLPELMHADPVKLEEINISEPALAEAPSRPMRDVRQRQRTEAKKAAPATIKAKKIASKGEGDESGNGELYQESRVIDPARQAVQPTSAPRDLIPMEVEAEEKTEEDPFTFLDVFKK